MWFALPQRNIWQPVPTSLFLFHEVAAVWKYWGKCSHQTVLKFFRKFWLVWKNWQVVLVVFSCMTFPGGGAVPLHLRVIFKTTI